MRTTWMRKFKPESIIRANHCSLSLVEGTESLRPRWSKAELNFWIMCITLPWCHHQLGSRTRFLSLLSFFLMESGRDRQPESGEEKKKKSVALAVNWLRGSETKVNQFPCSVDFLVILLMQITSRCTREEKKIIRFRLFQYHRSSEAMVGLKWTRWNRLTDFWDTELKCAWRHLAIRRASRKMLVLCTRDRRNKKGVGRERKIRTNEIEGISRGEDVGGEQVFCYG